MNHQFIDQPIKRGKWRRFIGREYFILKRHLRWLFGRERFACVREGQRCQHVLIHHRSLLLRPLRNVDMQLQHNKVTNLRIAISHLDGVTIRPGESMSVWRLVGRPTASKGYLEGLTICNGEISRGIGGGLCQLGNLLYWMALHSPLTIVERWRHSFDVFPDLNRTIPFACGATLSYNYIDLILRNDTEHTFTIHLWLDDTHLNGELLCSSALGLEYEVFETDHEIRAQWWGGYTRHNKIWKRIIDHNTGSIRTELVSENNAIMMYMPILEA